MEICQECKAILKSPNEFHPYEYCLLAKAEPKHWRRAVKYIIDNGNKYKIEEEIEAIKWRNTPVQEFKR